MSYPRFETLEEMERFYYGGTDSLIRKDAPVLSTTTGVWQQVYGRKVWSQLNYEANAFAVIPKEPWGKTGWRLLTAAAVSFPSGAVTEGASLPATVKPTWTVLYSKPATIIHGWDTSELAVALSAYDDAIDIIPHMREELGKEHARAISAYLVEDVDTPQTNGFESLDRIAFKTAYSTGTKYVSAASDPDLYKRGTDIDRSASASAFADAQVDAAGSASGAIRDLTLSLIDGVLADVLTAGGKPKVILCNHKTVKVWSALLEAERRFLDIGRLIPAYGGARGELQGVEAGFNVALYNGIPIIPCQDYTASIASPRTNEVGPVLMLDTDFLRIAVLKPTRYFETQFNEQMVAVGTLEMEGYYETIGELRCYGFPFQGKVQDIK